MHATTASDGTEIRYETAGEGEPLVLLHGSTGSHRSWDAFRPHLEGVGQLAIPDRRGRGASGDAEDYDLEREVEDLLAVLEDVGASRVFGHSFGGLCALEAARRRDLDRLVLFEPAILLEEHRDDAAERMAERIEDGDREGAMRVAFRATVGLEDVESLPHWPEVVELAEVTQRELAAVEAYRLPEMLEDVDVPTLVLTAEHSPQHLRDAAAAVHERLPDAQLAEIEGVGHTGAGAPERVAAPVVDFLDA